MEIYFDNSATTKPAECVIEKMNEVLYEGWGNPSSLHKIGMKAESYLKKSAKIIADEIGAAGEEIYFTSGGTESDNLAILGYARANKKRGNHIITTAGEHPAAAECFEKLKEEGFFVDCLNLDEKGDIDLSEFERLLKKETILVSIMHVNNEVGAVYPIEKLKSIMKLKSPYAALHSDAVQSFGKYEINVKKSGIDMLSMSAHKIHGPKGVGALYVKKGLIIKPVIYGGHQQKNLRSGTENVFAAAGMGEAALYMKKMRSMKENEVKKVKEILYKNIMANVDNVVLNGSESASSYILNLSFLGVRSEILLHSLEARNIFVSSGSACASNKPSPSVTLTKMKKTPHEIDSALRFSFSVENETEQAVYASQVIKEEVEKIRKHMR